MTLFPTPVFLEPWSNQQAQLHFLMNALRYTPEIFTMNQLLTRRVVVLDPQRANPISAAAVNSAWNAYDLTVCLIGMASSYDTTSLDTLVCGILREFVFDFIERWMEVE